MTTVEHMACWCGELGSSEHFSNFLGTKGKVAYVRYCSKLHKELFNSSGDMIALFRGSKFRLKKVDEGVGRSATQQQSLLTSYWSSF